MLTHLDLLRINGRILTWAKKCRTNILIKGEMIMNLRKRGLALLMCICMVFTLLPFSVFAEDAENGSRGGY